MIFIMLGVLKTPCINDLKQIANWVCVRGWIKGSVTKPLQCFRKTNSYFHFHNSL